MRGIRLRYESNFGININDVMTRTRIVPSGTGAHRVRTSSALYGVCCLGQRKPVDARISHADEYSDKCPLV